MKTNVLLGIVLLLGACTHSEKIPQVTFNLETCLAIVDDPNHPYHNNKFVVAGCNHVFTEHEEHAMRERSEGGSNASNPTPNHK